MIGDRIMPEDLESRLESNYSHVDKAMKNETEMKAERERIVKLQFDDLIKECKPINIRSE